MSFLGNYSNVLGGSSGLTGSQLQSTIAAATSSGELPPGTPHHPITCAGRLMFDSDGVFSCDHAKVPADDPRTHACLVHSLAILIIEQGIMNYSGMDKLPFDRYEDHYERCLAAESNGKEDL